MDIDSLLISELVTLRQLGVMMHGRQIARRLFDVLPSRVELEIVRLIDRPNATGVPYRVWR